MKLVRTILPVTLLASAMAVGGCTVNDNTPSPPPTVVATATGQLTVTWTVAGSASSDACAFYGADALEILVADPTGTVVADEFGNCEDFAITLELPVDMYNADVTLVDVDNAAVSTTLPLDALRVTDSTELVVDIDFPDSSML